MTLFNYSQNKISIALNDGSNWRQITNVWWQKDWRLTSKCPSKFSSKSMAFNPTSNIIMPRGISFNLDFVAFMFLQAHPHNSGTLYHYKLQNHPPVHTHHFHYSSSQSPAFNGYSWPPLSQPLEPPSTVHPYVLISCFHCINVCSKVVPLEGRYQQSKKTALFMWMWQNNGFVKVGFNYVYKK